MGQIRKIRWWQQFLDKDVRAAKRRLKNMSPNEQMVTVDYTDGGIAITVPHSIKSQWEEMPWEARQDFMRSVDEQIKNNPNVSAGGFHDAIVEG